MGASSRAVSRAALAGAGLGAMALSGCPVDDRQLGVRQPGALYAGAAGVGDGVPGDFPHGGEGGADGARGIWTFDHDIGAWQADEGVELGWSSVDAAHSAYSGSLAVTNAAAASADAYHSAGASVCVNARGGTTYDVSAELEIDGDQRTGSAGFAVEFFNVPGCEGLRLGVANYLSATTSRWVLGERTPTAPAGSQSALFHLVASKLGTDPPFTVRFDDVRFRAESE